MDLLLGHQVDRRTCPVLHFRRAHQGVLGEQPLGGKCVEAPFHQLDRGLVTPAPGRCGRCDDHQSAAIADRGAEEAVPRFVGEAGLDAVRTFDLADEGIVVGLRDAVERETLAPEEVVVERRMAGRQRLGEDGEIARRGEGRAAIHPAVGRAEMAVAHAQFAGGGVHLRDPFVDRAGPVGGQHDGAVVGGDRGDPAQQFLHRGHVADFEEHGGADPAPFLGNVGVHHHPLAQVDLLRRELLERDVCGHHLGDGGRDEAPVGIAGRQRLVGRHVEQEDDRHFLCGGAGRKLARRCLVAHLRGGGPRAQEEAGDQAGGLFRPEDGAAFLRDRSPIGWPSQSVVTIRASL